jgi:cellulose synthase (UDP-forming)
MPDLLDPTMAPRRLAPARRARAALPWYGVLAVAAALVAASAYLVWRWGWSMDGASLWISVPLAVAETYTVLMLALLVFSCRRLAERRTPRAPAGRRVAVLIATFDEDEDVLRPTVVGALAVRNDVPPEVWVLDDGGRPWVDAMCRELGARYLSRPAPRAGAKAGNLNHALGVVRAEFLVTLDADHVPRPDLVERMLGHMSDPRVAVVQGPQAFYNRGFGHPRAEDDPLRNEQSIFFDVICRGKDRHGAAFWCGCPSLLRRSAIMDVGGVATDTVVEDAHTSLRLNAAGWKVVYHDEVMALGVAPEEIGAFVVQRSRWARGSLQMLRLDMPLLKRGLTWRQRIAYTESCLHFLEGPQRLVGMLAPALVLATGAVPITSSPWAYAAIFLPQLVLVPLASKVLTRGHYRLLESERYSVVRMEAYLRALAALPRGTGGGFKVTPKGARTGGAPVARALRVPLALAGLTLAGVAVQTAAQILDWPQRLPDMASSITTVWALVNLALVVHTYLWAGTIQHRRSSHRFPVSAHAAYSADESASPSLPGRIEDVSRHGARLIAAEPREPGEHLRIVLLLEDGPLEVAATVATVTPERGGGHRIGLVFAGMSGSVGDALVAWCFANPFGDEIRVSPAPRALSPSGFLVAAETAATAEPADEDPVPPPHPA